MSADSLSGFKISVVVMCEVRLTGWRVGTRKVSLTLLIRDWTDLGLSQAKSEVDRLLAGDIVSLSLPDRATATAFCREAAALGAICQVDEPASET